ncbi:MAG: TIGR04086 family membrane protein [Eubacterium sp.]
MKRFKGFVVAYVLTAILLVLVAFVLYQTKASVEHMGGAILLVYAIAVFVGGMVFAAQRQSRHYLMGGLFGLAYFVIVYGISAIWNRSLSSMFPAMLTTLLVCVLAGMLGGMLGPRKNGENRS